MTKKEEEVFTSSTYTVVEMLSNERRLSKRSCSWKILTSSSNFIRKKRRSVDAITAKRS